MIKNDLLTGLDDAFRNNGWDPKWRNIDRKRPRGAGDEGSAHIKFFYQLVD